MRSGECDADKALSPYRDPCYQCVKIRRSISLWREVAMH